MTTILVIDDSFLQRHILKKLLQKRDYQVVETASGTEALTLLADERVDIVICDLLMPEMSGLEVLERVREMDGALPFVMVAADLQQRSREQSLEQGASAFLSKPIREEALFSVLEDLIARSESA